MVQRISFYEEIRNNKIKSVLLMFSILIFFIILGYLISLALDPGYFFIIMAFTSVFSVLYVWIGYYNSHKMALASVNAKLASKTEHKRLYDSVESMSIASGLPMPKVYVMESEQINAFASGRNPQNAVICVTTGCLRKLNKQELEGVIAHEMAHIANFDIRFMTLTAVLVGLISMIAQIYLRSFGFNNGNKDNKNGVIILISIIAAILAPLFAQIVSLAISRRREFTADATGVKFTRYPKGLANALKAIKNESASEEDKRKYSNAIAPLFISNPFKKNKIKSIFSTHPDIDERISRLERM